MKGRRHVLLPTDLTLEALEPCSDPDGPVHDANTLVTVLHAIRSPSAVPLGPTPVAVAAPAPEGPIPRVLDTLRSQVRALDLGPDVGVDAVVGDDVAGAILDYAHEHGVDWIVLSSHGRKGLRRLLLGRTAETIVREADVPVLVYPRNG
jgi:nucleotide-binding universal stress UspA family protein